MIYLKNKSTNIIKIVILIMILSGMLIGIFSSIKLEKQNYQLTYSNKSYLQLFINSFTTNYWYFFIIWLTGLIPFGFVLTSLFAIIKSFLTGVIVCLSFKGNGIFGLLILIRYGFLEFLIILPLLYFVSYHIFLNTLIGRNYLNKKTSYFNILIIITLFIVLYSLLISIKFNVMEVK